MSSFLTRTDLHFTVFLSIPSKDVMICKRCKTRPNTNLPNLTTHSVFLEFRGNSKLVKWCTFRMKNKIFPTSFPSSYGVVDYCKINTDSLFCF